MGISPETYESKTTSMFSHVVYCAPPSGAPDYAASVAEAVACWDGTGSFIFTSSTGVFSRTEDITEDTPTIALGENPRIDRLLRAEQTALEVSRDDPWVKQAVLCLGGRKCSALCWTLSFAKGSAQRCHFQGDL